MTDTVPKPADPALVAGAPLARLIDVGKSYGAIRALRGINQGQIKNRRFRAALAD